MALPHWVLPLYSHKRHGNLKNVVTSRTWLETWIPSVCKSLLLCIYESHFCCCDNILNKSSGRKSLTGLTVQRCSPSWRGGHSSTSIYSGKSEGDVAAASLTQCIGRWRPHSVRTFSFLSTLSRQNTTDAPSPEACLLELVPNAQILRRQTSCYNDLSRCTRRYFHFEYVHV